MSTWHRKNRAKTSWLSFVVQASRLRFERQAGRLHHNPRTALAAILLAVSLVTGCQDAATPTAEPDKLPLHGMNLRVTVADDPAMAAEIRRLRDEWTAQTGAELQVAETTEKDLLAAKSLEGDAVICPAYLLGPLAEAKSLAEIPRTFHRDNTGPWSEVFDLLRLREATWGSRTYAVPLGSPVLCCYYRADLLEKLGRQPPQTWAEYHDLAKLLSPRPLAGEGPGVRALGSETDSMTAPSAGTIEPLGPGWAGLMLIARSAAYAKHPDSYSVLFDIETMEPQIDSPPFVRGLDELVETAKLGPPEQLGYDPGAVRAAFWQGKCGLAITWPTAARQSAPLTATGGARVGFAALPGAAKVYNRATRAWDTRPEGAETRVPLLDVAGRIGVVPKSCQHAEAAVQLLFWLAGSQSGGRVCPASAATTLFSRAQAGIAQDWVEKPVSASAAAAYAALTAETFRCPQSVPALRVPGRAEYLAALDEAVQAAVQGKQSSAAALRAAAARWREITKRLGLPAQKIAYRHDLGLD